MANEMKLIGYKRFTSKKGKDVCIAHVLSEFNEREKANGAFGSHVDDVFMPDEQLDFLNPGHIGKNFVATYGLGDFGKPVIVRVDIK